jgi:ParB/RepB/Spo0J family partition protein
MTTTTISLNKLIAWDGNVRKTDSDKAISELAASIAAHGLLQSLVVRKDKRGKYAVIAGRRRLLALKWLAENADIPANSPVACTVLEDEADATEIGLAENVQREAMHPADEFEAFRALVDDGMPVADIAARFGVTEPVVQKRLKLARVSPIMLPPTPKAMRADDARRSQAPRQDFALGPDALQSLGCASTAPATSPPAPATVPTPRIGLPRPHPTSSSRPRTVRSSAPARNKNALCSDRSRSARRSTHATLYTLPICSASSLNSAASAANQQDGLQIALTEIPAFVYGQNAQYLSSPVRLTYCSFCSSGMKLGNFNSARFASKTLTQARTKTVC